MIDARIADGHQDGYLDEMSEYSIAESKNQLPSLIDRMLAGESVTITRRGRPVARLTPVENQARPRSPVDLAWLDDLREKSRTPTSGQTDTVAEMRRTSRY